MDISIILPSRNNLKYLQWSYAALRKNQGAHNVQICVADDASIDGTWDWCVQKMQEDYNFNAIKNAGPKRLGHTILYDKLVEEVAKYDICMIYHADMYLLPGALDAIDNHIEEGTIVSLTRIEPPLHPDGPEKVLLDFGTEPEHFKEQELLEIFDKEEFPWETKIPTKRKTEGIFAPWAFYKSDFLRIGGHDPLYLPQSKEDSDIFNRFGIAGIEFVQTWDGYVYHMTCRGSRFNPTITQVGKNSTEWEIQNNKSERNFRRKWGSAVKHDAYLKPIILPKYKVTVVIKGLPSLQLIETVEPLCSVLYVDKSLIQIYIKIEQPNTDYNLSERVVPIEQYNHEEVDGVIVYIDANAFTRQDFVALLELSSILKEQGEVGAFELFNMQIVVKDLKSYEDENVFLIK